MDHAYCTTPEDRFPDIGTGQVSGSALPGCPPISASLPSQTEEHLCCQQGQYSYFTFLPLQTEELFILNKMTPV